MSFLAIWWKFAEYFFFEEHLPSKFFCMNFRGTLLTWRVNSILAGVPFLYPLKTSENRFSDVFRGYKKEVLGSNRLRKLGNLVKDQLKILECYFRNVNSLPIPDQYNSRRSELFYKNGALKKACNLKLYS